MLQFTKKKRKRSDSGSDADLDFVEREEQEDDDLLSDKRRSGRRAGPRKKYVDDVQLDLSDDENLLMNLPPGMFTIVLTAIITSAPVERSKIDENFA